MDLNNVRITEKGMAELDGDDFRCSVPRETIRNVSVRYGPHAERPLRQLTMSFVFLTIGLFPLRKALAGFQGWSWSVREWAMMAFLIPAVAATYGSFARGLYLHVETETGRRKLPFKPRPSEADLERFIQEAEGHGYEIARLTD